MCVINTCFKNKKPSLYKKYAQTLLHVHALLTCLLFLQWPELLHQTWAVTGSGWHAIPLYLPLFEKKGAPVISTSIGPPMVAFKQPLTMTYHPPSFRYR